MIGIWGAKVPKSVNKYSTFTITYYIWYLTLPFNHIFSKIFADDTLVHRKAKTNWFFFGIRKTTINMAINSQTVIRIEAGYVDEY